MGNGEYHEPGGTGFKRGNPGRRKGSPNKTSRALVEQILQALEERGGLEYLKKLNPALFNALIARVIPKDVHITGTVTFEHRLAELERSKTELEQTAKSGLLPPPSK